MSVAEHDDNTKTSDNSPLHEQNKKEEYKNPKREDSSEKIQAKESEVIQLINNIILEIIEDNKKEIPENKVSSLPKTVFFMKNLPNIKFLEYLKRIFKYLKPEISSMIIALIYVDRICSEKTNKIVLIDNNIFKLFLTATILAIKYNEDFYDDNAYFAKVGGIKLKEVNVLEKEFLDLINFRMFVSVEIFDKYNNYLINY
jgi:hypothetical protein